MDDNDLKFAVNNLKVCIDNHTILNGIDLMVNKGELHIIMGPNGSGKSTLANSIMGDSRYRIEDGTIRIDDVELNNISVDERARKGIFLAFQYPVEIPGVSLSKFIWSAQSSLGKNTTLKEFQVMLENGMKMVALDSSFSKRSLNEGLSGGEKKRSEMLQAYMLKPRLIILDEIDSGLDVDALRQVSDMINHLLKNNSAVILITHYQRIIENLTPPYRVHILVNGKIVQSGGYELVKKIEADGYESFKEVN
ncbi:MAG: Fe-S cluster assembly ATPase SufC [Candidatus Thermoplasmatota archaeon]|nr:Fe-S cluster assembly ATPase SufC [Candidatus Thermoplasmatota archaeon]MCL5963982.1 Fe-S cluster assembly ATPase SufC [Candidatus Thermoplasmatota archaeon]